MSRHRHLAAVVIGLLSIAVTVLAFDGSARVLSSPLLAIELAAVATAVTLQRQSRHPRAVGRTMAGPPMATPRPSLGATSVASPG